MHYVSTRGRAPTLDFADVLLAGLADDGGLYVPETWPPLPPLDSLRGRPYAEVASEVMWAYVEGSFERDVFDSLVAEACSQFDDPDVCPITVCGDLHVMELFHGPTAAFKDVALQLVGRLFDHVLTERDARVTILGATSGDTGSAAMEAFRGRDHADCVILFPDGRVSDVQRRQMTTVVAGNCHAVAVDGTFDDCQDLVKAAFGDQDFRHRVNLSAVNSINWARVMAQIVYYVWASLHVAPEGGPVTFVVPTGNFGNILAGWVAKRMGLPVDRLVIASNRNDILTRFFTSGEMSIEPVVPTTSPSMDIQVSSNLERLLFEVLGRDGAAVTEMLGAFRSDGQVAVPVDVLDELRREFDADRLDEAEVQAVMKRAFETDGILLDPHSAIGVGVGQRITRSVTPIVSLATAHPAKFPDAVEAATGVRPEAPASVAAVMDLPERIEHIPADLATVQALVKSLRST
jgi:threonine synthase